MNRNFSLETRLIRLTRNGMIISFCMALLSGLCLSWYYIPTPEKAALSISYIGENVFAGAVVLKIHYCASVLLFISLIVNVLAYLGLKKFSAPSGKILLWGALVGVLLMCFGITGYILKGTQISENLLKMLLLSGLPTDNGADSTIHLYDTVATGLVRSYLFHIGIFPVLAGSLFYWYLRNTGGLRLKYTVAGISIASQGILLLSLITLFSAYIVPDAPRGLTDYPLAIIIPILKPFMTLLHGCSGEVIAFVTLFMIIIFAFVKPFFRKKKP